MSSEGRQFLGRMSATGFFCCFNRSSTEVLYWSVSKSSTILTVSASGTFMISLESSTRGFWVSPRNGFPISSVTSVRNLTRSKNASRPDGCCSCFHLVPPSIVAAPQDALLAQRLHHILWWLRCSARNSSHLQWVRTCYLFNGQQTSLLWIISCLMRKI